MKPQPEVKRGRKPWPTSIPSIYKSRADLSPGSTGSCGCRNSQWHPDFSRDLMLLHRVFGGDNQPRCAIGDLRAVAGRDLAQRALEHRVQGCELLDRGIRPDAVVMIVERA